MCLICVSTISIAALMAPSDAPDQMPTQSPAQISMKVSGTNSSSLLPKLPVGLANSANLSEKDKKYIQVPYLAWNEIIKYQIPSNNKVKIQIHASKNFDEKAKLLFAKGVQSSVDQFAGVFKPGDTIHLILATNYDDAIKFTDEVIAELPEYAEYKTSHLNVAKNNFTGQVKSFGGGTSSRGCSYPGSQLGDKGGSQVTPCPELKGGSIYWFGSYPPNLEIFMEKIGYHEAMHLVFSKLNKMNHYRVPDWIIEGTIDSISFANVTKNDNLTNKPSIFNPAPRWIPLENGKSYDLSKLDNQNSGDERFSIGTLAISLLISEFGAKKVFDFMSVVGFPRQWKDVFLESFGYSAEEFYKKFADYHAWYFYENGFNKIQSTYSSKAIICTKAKTTKKVSGTNPKCPKGYKVKA